MINNYLKLYLCVVFGLISSAGFSQKPSTSIQQKKATILADRKVAEVQVSAERSTPSLILFDRKQNGYAKAETPALLRNYLALRNGYDDMLPSKDTKVYTNFDVPEYQQYFKGVKVEYSKYKALTKDNQLMLLAGSFYEIPAGLSVTPNITEAQALVLAKNQIGAKQYVYEEIEKAMKVATDPQLKKALSAEYKETYPKGELTVVKDFTNVQATEMRLAYKFNLYASEPLSRGYIFVDAQTGKILLYNAIIKHTSVPTNVQTRYAGTRTINVSQISGNDPNSGQQLQSSHPGNETYILGSPTFVLLDDTRGKGIETYDLNGVGGAPISLGPVYALGKSFTDVDNNWTLAQHKRGPGEQGANEAENDDIAWDAHWGAEIVYDYWKQKQGRLSYDNNNTIIKSFIHYGPAYDNAFWNGTAMTYGDGSGEAAGGFKPLTSLDVCGHEIGHGVCSFTSDLVYEKESGAMNEALSDIWAAAVEYYAVKNVDPTLASIYKPFFIGEQISANPLRRMDAPKLTGNPDTYGGDNWSNPDCTPTLANDQCGVHNNSGLLNKWFYLVTLGSGNGSGPDADFVIPGADDQINDNGNAYSVTGLGFDVAERLTYLTELLLSSTATYAEFRDVVIGVAKSYSGDPCGPIVQSVTNAMYAIGVGPMFVAPCVTTFGFVFQPGLTVSENNGEVGCTALRTINVPVLLPANSTANFTFGGTATLNVDYTVSGNLTNSGSGNKQDTLKIMVKNDAIVEGTETITVSSIVTNNGTNPTNTAYTITILDDDVTPKIGKDALVLFSDNFDSYATGFAQPSTYTEVFEIPVVAGIDPLANGKNQWGVFNGRLAIAPNLPGPAIAGETYLNTSTSQTRITAPMIDARGLTNVQLKFDYTVQGEVDPNGTEPDKFGLFDFMAVAYSYDNVNFVELGDKFRFASAAPISATFSETLPGFLDNQQFYLSFRWVNDTNAGGPTSVSIDNLEVKADPRKIETTLSNFSQENTTPNEEVYFYSRQTGNIIARINNVSSTDYGCTNVNFQRSGTTTSELYANEAGSHKVGDKFIRITPATNNPTGSYDISLYYTEEEIAAIEGTTGKTRTAFSIYKTSSPTIEGANSSNTEMVAASYTNLPGAGGIFTAPFSTGFSGFAVGSNVPGPLPVTCLELQGTRNGNSIQLNWKVATEQNNRRFEVERSVDGINFSSINAVPANERNNGSYQYADKNVAGIGDVYYRLKQFDANGSFRYVCNTLLLRMTGKELSISNVYPNPVKGNAFVKISTANNTRLRVEIMNGVGQLINAYNETLSGGNNIITLKTASATSGNYMVRFKDSDGKVLQTQSFIVK